MSSLLRVLVFRFNHEYELIYKYEKIKYVDVNNIKDIENYLLDNDLMDFSDTYLVINKKNDCFVKSFFYKNFDWHYPFEYMDDEEEFNAILELIAANDIRDDGDFYYHMEGTDDHSSCEV